MNANEKKQHPGLTRSVDLLVTRSSDDADATSSVAMSFASTEPVRRWDWLRNEEYDEVLDLDAVDLSRAADGLPLLLDHDRRSVVGRVEDITVVDGKLRGVARFSRSALGQEVLSDVLDGIRREMSVGYQEGKRTLVSKDDKGVPTYRVGFTPFEATLTAIPADHTVGVGRAATETAPVPHATVPTRPVEVRMSEQTTPTNDDVLSIERKRNHELIALANEHKLGVERATSWITGGVTIDAARAEVLGEYQKRAANGARPEYHAVDLTPKEQQSFSVVRAINSLLRGERSGFEFEVSDEIAKKHNRNTQGFFVPWQVQAEGLAGSKQRANELVVGTASVGGNLKFTEYAGFIEMLRNRLVTQQLGVQYLPGLQGSIQFTKQTGATTFSWMSTEISNATNSAWTLGTVTAAPKIGQAASHISRQLLAQAVESVEGRVRSDIVKQHAIGIDLAVLSGTGSSGQPTGISATSGIGDVAGGTNGAVPTYSHILELWSDVATANAEVSSMKYLTHPLGVSRLAQTQRFSSTDTPLWRFSDQPGSGIINEIPAMYSTQVLSAQTKGTSTDCYYIFFGDWSAATLCEWGAMELILDPYTVGPSLVAVKSIQMVDVAVTQNAAFSVMKDARP